MPHQCTNCGRTFADGSKEMLSGCPDCEGTKFQFSPDGFDDGPDPSAEPPERPDPPDRPGAGMGGTVGNAAATVRDLVRGSASPDATSATPPDSDSDPDPDPDDTPAPAPADSMTAGTSGGAGDDDIIVAESREDAAQADARTQVAGPDDLPDGDGDAEGDVDRSAATSAESDTTAATSAGSDAAASEPPVAGDDAGTAGDDDRTVAEEPDAETADRPDLAELREELNDQFESIRIVERGQYELNLMELYDRDEVIVALQEDGRYSIRVPEAIGEADV